MSKLLSVEPSEYSQEKN